jgi:hypothetical protein
MLKPYHVVADEVIEVPEEALENGDIVDQPTDEEGDN